MTGHFAFFDTSAGRCAIAWTKQGVAGLQLPEADEPALRAAMASKHAGFTESAPTKAVSAAIAGIRALLSGERRALAEITLDMSGIPPFHRQVYEEARRILPGHTRTYGELAHTLGKPGAARFVSLLKTDYRPCGAARPRSRAAVAWSVCRRRPRSRSTARLPRARDGRAR